MKRGRKSWKEMLNEPLDYNYGTINGKYSKYKKGEKITDLDTLLKQKQVIFYDMCRNIAWVESQQLRSVLRFLKNGCLYKAELKPKKEKRK